MYILILLISIIKAQDFVDEKTNLQQQWEEVKIDTSTQITKNNCQKVFASSSKSLIFTIPLTKGFSELHILFDAHFKSVSGTFKIKDQTNTLIYSEDQSIILINQVKVCLLGQPEFMKYYHIDYPFTSQSSPITLTLSHTAAEFYIRNFKVFIKTCDDNCANCDNEVSCSACKTDFSLQVGSPACICNGFKTKDASQIDQCGSTCPPSTFYSSKTKYCEPYTSITQIYQDQFGLSYTFHSDYNTTTRQRFQIIDSVQVGGTFIQNEYISYDINYPITTPIDIVIEQTLYFLGPIELQTSIDIILDGFTIDTVIQYEILLSFNSIVSTTTCVTSGYSSCTKLQLVYNLYQISSLNNLKFQGKFNVTDKKQAWAHSNLKISKIVWTPTTTCLKQYNNQCFSSCPPYTQELTLGICTDLLSQYTFAEYVIKAYYETGTFFLDNRYMNNFGIVDETIAQFYDPKYIYGGYNIWQKGELKLSINCKPHFKARLYLKLLLIDFNTDQHNNVTVYFDTFYKLYLYTDGISQGASTFGDYQLIDYIVDINSNQFEIIHHDDLLEISINCNGNEYGYCGIYDFFVIIALCPINCIRCSNQLTCLEVQMDLLHNQLTVYYNCQDGYFKQNGQCIKCQSGCKICNNELSCLQCFDNFIFYGSLCYCQYSKLHTDYCSNDCHKTCSTCTSYTIINNYDFFTSNRYKIIKTCQSCNINEKRVMNIKNCECQEGYYLDSDFNCTICDGRCKTCLINAKACTSCSSLQNRELITQYCNCKPNYYEVDDSFTCMTCSQYCKTCLYFENYCTSCYTAQNRVLTDNECVCQIGYFDKLNQLVCQKCNDLCEYCSDTDICTSCNDFQFRTLQNSSCICQTGYYDDEQLICKQCYYTCTQCNHSNEFNQCTSCPNTRLRSNNLTNVFECKCRAGYYDNLEYQCIDCSTYQYPPIDHYCYTKCGDGIVQWNEDCDDANLDERDGCNQCYFTNSKCLNQQCTKCFLGDCTKCIDGYYLGEDSTCHQCSSQCITCQNSETQCIQCKFYTSTNQCILCNSDVGYTIILDQCISICGDGIKTKEELCDDSNLQDGDGCSQYCTVEDGWVCNNTCIKIDYVDILLQESSNDNVFSSKRQIHFTFDQPVKLTQNNNIKDSIVIVPDNNTFAFSIDSIKDNTQYSDSLSEINLLIQISLQQTVNAPQIIVALFNNITIVNKDDFPIKQRNKTIKLIDFQSLSQSEISSSKSLNKFNSFLVYLLIGFMALAFILGGMDIFWNLLDTFQVLSYLKYLNVIYPYNLDSYFEIFGFAEFDFLKSNISVEDLLSSSIPPQQAPPKFDEQGYTSIFYVNIVAVFIVLITTIGTYILFHIIFYIIYKYAKYISTTNILEITNYEPEPNVLKFLCYKFTRNLQDYFYRLKIEYQNGILRAFLTVSYDLNLAIFLQLFHVSTENNAVLLTSYIFALLFFIFEIFLIYYGIIVMSRGRNYFQIEEIKHKYGALYEGIVLEKNPFSYYYNIILFLKKTLFMLILVSLYNYPTFQVTFVALLNCLFFSYLIYNKPLEQQAEQIKQITTETLLWFAELLILLLAYGTQSNSISYQSFINLGWLIICVLTLLILIQLLIDVRQHMIFLIENYRFIQILVAKFRNFHDQIFNKNMVINHDESMSLVDSGSGARQRQKRNSKSNSNFSSQKQIRKLVTFKFNRDF